MTERLYYRDSTLREFTAVVISTSTASGQSVVELDRTAFYPTSGGQPHDLGEIDGTSVVDVIDSQSTILHVLTGPAPAIGSRVRGIVDARRRFDHTQQHSGQHVLSQACERVGAMRTVAFHLGADAATIDVDRAGLDPDDLRVVEDLANQIVFEDRPVLIHFARPDEVGRFDLRKESSRTGDIRIVEVADFDRSACGGTHVERTGQIGPIKIRRTDRRGASTRIEFLCGWRALRDYAMRLQSTRDIAGRLSVADHEVGEAVFRSLDDLDRIRTESRHLRDRLLDEEADRLIARSTLISQTSGTRLVRQSFTDRPAEDLKRLARRLVSRGDVVALLGSAGERTHLLFARSPSRDYDVGAILRQVAPVVGAKGGGTDSLAQGGGPRSNSVESALDAAARLLGPV